MATERISENGRGEHISKLIGAIDLGLSKGDGALKIPLEQFGFNAVIETENTRLTNKDLDFEYDIPFDDNIMPNEATITLYNLTTSTISNFKKDNEIVITSGYNTDTGVVFRGNISKVITKHDGLDKVTKVYALDNYNYNDVTIVEETFNENTKASFILKTLIERLGLPVEVFKVQRDHVYESATTIKGSMTSNIKTYANICGVSVWINKQRIYCRPIWDGDNIHFTISSATGMIDSPEPFEEENTSQEYKDSVTGYNIEMLAQHRMTTAAIVDVDSKDYKGTYRVCSGSHKYDGLSATTEIKCIENITTEIVQKTTSSGTNTSNSNNNTYIDLAVEWAVKIANNDSYKYIWGGWGKSDGGYDCGHFVIAAYEQAGVKLKSNGATYTGDIKSAALKSGFKDVTSSCNLSNGSGMKKGDILLNENGRGTTGNGHAALVQIDGGKTVEARGKEYGIVSNQAYRNYPWDCVLRYTKNDTTSLSNSNSSGNWVKGHTATTYGNTSADDNGICGWNGLNYHKISGCHVAIPTYCVKQANCYNSIWAKTDYPELANGYGVILEVRNPNNNKIVRAVVADCGNFGKHNKYNHNTALDLPPNTQRALGLNQGTHNIEYRVVGSVKKWNGEQL